MVHRKIESTIIEMLESFRIVAIKGLVALAKTMNYINFKDIVLYGGEQILPYKVDDYQFWAMPLKVLI